MISSKLNNILQCILNEKRNFCTLCFTVIDAEVNALNISDRIIFKSEYELSIVQILNFILSPNEIVNYDFMTSYICPKCTKTAITCYLFIKKFKDNIIYLSNIMKNFTNAIKLSLEENLNYVKIVYLVTNNENFKCQNYYDTKCDINTISAAKLRIQSILSEDQIDESFISIDLVPTGQESNSCDHKKRNITCKSFKINMMCEKDGETNIKCKVCLKAYPNMSNFRHHYIRVHAPKMFKCSKCPKYFGSTVILDQHISECHLDVVCSICGKKYKNRHYLKVHELSHKVNFTCHVCQRRYKTQKTYNAHLSLNICGQRQRKSVSDAKFTCDICKKQFCHKASIKVHIKLEHGNGKAYECDWCQKRFSAQSRLNAHMVKHTREKNFVCTTCNGRFVTKESLSKHIRLHTGERPFKCLECNSAFISSTQRLTHTRRYHKLPNFECRVCHCKFNSKISFENHMLICKSKEKYSLDQSSSGQYS